MASKKRKFYVVWVGREPGIYEDWDDCQAQVAMFPGAKYKAFDSQTAATIAFRGDAQEEGSIIRAIADHNAAAAVATTAGSPSLFTIPEINPNAIAVDGACSNCGGKGAIEYRGVWVATGQELFHVGPLAEGTNNVAEYLALVHALAYLYQRNDSQTPIYCDSVTARSWVRNHGHRSKLEPTKENRRLFELLARADNWVQTHRFQNPILRWDTERWGEIPADFGRK